LLEAGQVTGIPLAVELEKLSVPFVDGAHRPYPSAAFSS
jgi:hypothetical protein